METPPPPEPRLRARPATIEALFLGHRLELAPVQRDFRWTPKECRELLDDLVRVSGVDPVGDDGARTHERPIPGYFLGNIIVSSRGVDRQVFDGFQRVTALTLLVAVLRDLLVDEPSWQARLQALVTDGEECRLHLRGRVRWFDDLVREPGSTDGVARPRVRDGGLSARLQRAALTFRDGLGPFDVSGRVRLAEALLTKFHVVIVEIDDARVARQAVVTAHARGQLVDATSIFKAQLVELVERSGTPRLLAVLGELEERLGRDGLAAFLRALDLVVRRQAQGPDHLSALGEHVRARYGGDLESFAQIVQRYGEAWLRLQEWLDDPTRDRYGGHAWRLGILEWSEWQPCALQLARCQLDADVEGGGDWIADRFAALHERCVVFTLARLGPGARSRAFLRAVRRGADPLGATLALGERQLDVLHETLASPLPDEIARPLVRWIECTATTTPSPWSREGTLEHVLPERPRAGSRWEAAFPDPDQRDDLCRMLGNLGLVSEATHREARDEDFDVKSRCYRADAWRFEVMDDVRAATTWDEAAIRDRTRRLGSLVCERLGLSVALPAGDGPGSCAGPSRSPTAG